MALLDFTRRRVELPVLHPPVSKSPEMGRALSFLERTGGLSVDASVRAPSVTPVHYRSRRAPWGLMFGLIVAGLMVCAFYYGSQGR